MRDGVDVAGISAPRLVSFRAPPSSVRQLVSSVVWQTRSHVQGARQVSGVVPRHVEVRTVFQVHLREDLRHLRMNHLRKVYLRKVAN